MNRFRAIVLRSLVVGSLITSGSPALAWGWGVETFLSGSTHGAISGKTGLIFGETAVISEPTEETSLEIRETCTGILPT